MNDKLLQLLGQSQHMSDWELAKKQSKKPDVVYAGLVKDLQELEGLGEVAIIGKKFIDQHGKLFDVYTVHTDSLPERINAYNIKQKNAQILSLANALYDEFKEHMTAQALIDAAELIKQGKGKINLKYHALERSEILAVYKRVAKDAADWFVKEQKHNAIHEKKFKIPY